MTYECYPSGFDSFYAARQGANSQQNSINGRFYFFFLVRPTVHVRTNDDPNGKAKRLAEIKAFFFSLLLSSLVGRPSVGSFYLFIGSKERRRRLCARPCERWPTLNRPRERHPPYLVPTETHGRHRRPPTKYLHDGEDLGVPIAVQARVNFVSPSPVWWKSTLSIHARIDAATFQTARHSPTNYKLGWNTQKKPKEGTTEEAAIKSEMDICFPSSIFWRREWERRSPRRHVEENDIKDKLRQTAGKASKIPRHYISQKHRRCFQTTWEKEKGDQQVQSASLKTFGLGKMARRWAAKLGVAPAVQYAWANKGNTHTRARVYNNNYQDQGPGNSTIQADCIIWSHPPAKYLPKSRRLQKFSVLSSARNGGHGNNNEFNPFSAQADH